MQGLAAGRDLVQAVDFLSAHCADGVQHAFRGVLTAPSAQARQQLGLPPAPPRRQLPPPPGGLDQASACVRDTLLLWGVLTAPSAQARQQLGTATSTSHADSCRHIQVGLISLSMCPCQ